MSQLIQNLDLLLILALGLPFAATSGFFAGVYFERGRAARTFQQAKRSLDKLFNLVVGRLDSAREACALLEKFPNATLNESRVERLNTSQGQLLEVVQKVVVREQGRLEAETLKRQFNAPLQEAVEVTWTKEPTDPRSELPSRETTEANLGQLLTSCQQSGASGGLLLIQIDKFRSLYSRFGKEEANHFLRTVASLASQQLEEADFLSQFSDDTLAILMQNQKAERGSTLANSIRNSIRNHRFRLNDGKVEVLVTASLGYTAISRDDNSALAMQRAADALIRSQKRGRNQLHVFDGTSLTHLELASAL